MAERLNYLQGFPEGIHAILNLEKAIRASGLEPALSELIKIRASQMNGCAFCLDMHTKDARAAGETEQRIYALSAWRETPFFSARDRAALALTESVTLRASTHVPDADFEQAAAEFSAAELAALISLITMINAWNAIGVSTHAWLP